jgi:hypothetical protein
LLPLPLRLKAEGIFYWLFSFIFRWSYKQYITKKNVTRIPKYRASYPKTTGIYSGNYQNYIGL